MDKTTPQSVGRDVAKLFARLALLIGLTFAAQVAFVGKLRPAKDVRNLERCLAAQPDVLFFCDSTNRWIDGRDNDRRPIADMLGGFLDGSKVGSIDRGGYHAEVYEAFLELLARRRPPLRGIVVPINLRSFSAEWDLRPAYQFAEAQAQLRLVDDRLAYAAYPLLRTWRLWPEPESITPDGFRHSPVHQGTVFKGEVRDFENPSYREVTPERVKNKLIYQYLYGLTDDHRKLTALRRIADLAARERLPVVFYVSPVDWEVGEEYLPGEFRRQVEANVAVIRRQLADYRPPLIDLALSLPAEAFSWSGYPCEHLRDTGRQLVARHVALALHDAWSLPTTLPGRSKRPYELQPSRPLATRPTDSPR